MGKVSLTTLKKYVSIIKSSKEKHLTVDKLSRKVGVYSEIISENLSIFDPMINIDMEYNVKDLLIDIENYIEEETNKRKATSKPREVVKRGELSEYSSIQDFVYQKLSFDGIIDRSATLSDHDLKILKKLIAIEQAKRNKKKK